MKSAMKISSDTSKTSQKPGTSSTASGTTRIEGERKFEKKLKNKGSFTVSRPSTCARKIFKSEAVIKTRPKSVDKMGDFDNSKSQPVLDYEEERALEEFVNKGGDVPSVDRKSTSLSEMIALEGSIESLINSKKSKCLYNVEEMSGTDLQASVHRLKEDPVEPFSFLRNVFDDVAHSEEKEPTDVDLQLKTLLKRVELNKTLLERTNQRVKDVNFLVERNGILASRDLNYDEKSFLKIKESGEPAEDSSVSKIKHPGIDELQRTMKVTMEMLKHIKKIALGETRLEDIDEDLLQHMSVKNVEDNS